MDTQTLQCQCEVAAASSSGTASESQVQVSVLLQHTSRSHDAVIETSYMVHSEQKSVNVQYVLHGLFWTQTGLLFV